MIQLMPGRRHSQLLSIQVGQGISVDYSAVRLCTLAQVCLWEVGENTRRGHQRRTRPHCIMAANLTGPLLRRFLRGVYGNGDLECKDTRQAGKAANFGYPGMMGAPSLSSPSAARIKCEWLHRDDVAAK